MFISKRSEKSEGGYISYFNILIVALFIYFVVLNTAHVLSGSVLQSGVVLVISVVVSIVLLKIVKSYYLKIDSKGGAVRIRSIYGSILLAVVTVKAAFYIGADNISLSEAVVDTALYTVYLLGISCILFWIYFVSVAIGRLILDRLHVAVYGIKGAVVLFGVGQITLSYSMLVLGVLGLFYSWIVYALMCIPLFVFREQLKGYIVGFLEVQIAISDVQGWFRTTDTRYRMTTLSVVALFIVTLFVIILNSISVFPYVTDTLRAYSSFPKLYAEEHALVSYDASRYNYYPKNAEMLYTLGYLMLDHNVGNLLIVLYLIGIVTLLVVLSQKLIAHSRYRGPPALAFYFILIPAVMFFGYGNQKVDLIMLFYVLLAVYIAMRMADEKKTRAMIGLFGLFCGMALGIKYTAVISVFAVFVALILLYRKNIRQLLTVWFVAGSIVLIMFSPWAIRNYVLVGDPVAPFFLEQLNSGDTLYDALGPNSYTETVQASRDSSYYQLFNQEEKGLKYYVALPFRIVSNNSGLIMRLNDMGPVFVPLLLLLAYGAFRLDRKSVFVVSVIVVHLIAYILVIENTVIWYILPVFALLLVLYERALSRLSVTRHVLVLHLVLLAGIIAVFMNARIHHLSLVHPYPKLENINLEGVGDYSFSRFAQLMQIEKMLTSDEFSEGKVHFANDGAVYFFSNFHERFIPATYLEIFGYLFDGGMTNSEITARLKNMDIKYILLNRGQLAVNQILLERAKVHSPNISEHYSAWAPAFADYADSELEIIYRGSVYYLYRFKE